MFILLFLFDAVPAHAATFVNETSQFTITRSGLVFNRSTNTFDSLVTITNSSASSVNGPLVLAVSRITPATITLVNHAGQDTAGNPYVNLVLPSTGLSPGQSISNVLLKFGDPSRVSFTFTPLVEGSQAQAVLSPDGSSILFKNSNGTVILTIPVVNQTTVLSTPNGKETTKVIELPIISDDGSHVGINSTTITALSPELEGLGIGTFRYYDSRGQLWEVVAPNDSDFYQPLSFRDQRLLTPDGSRVLLISAEAGNSYPSFSVYDQKGDLLYKVPVGLFLGLYQAQLSPNGKYLLVVGTIKKNNVREDLVRVYDLAAQLSFDFPFDITTAGEPTISVYSDGRFQITSQGNHLVLPPS